jgi:hypothetical protein
MVTQRSRFWQQFRRVARQLEAALFDHKPGQPWDSNRHVGERPRYFAHYVYHIRADEADVSLEIHARKGDVSETNRIYRFLESAREEVEAAFGEKLVWEPRPTSDVSFVRFVLRKGGLNDEDQWADLQRHMVVTMVRLMAALQPVVEQTPGLQ